MSKPTATEAANWVWWVIQSHKVQRPPWLPYPLQTPEYQAGWAAALKAVEEAMTSEPPGYEAPFEIEVEP